MGIIRLKPFFFDADKYITRVESPRVKNTLDRKAQIIEYIKKYFEEFSPDYLDDVRASCIRYIQELPIEQHNPEQKVTSAETQAVSTIIMWLQSFVAEGNLEKMQYMRVLAAKEAFKLYCGMISKTMDLRLIDRKTARKRITKFYKDCGLG